MGCLLEGKELGPAGARGLRSRADWLGKERLEFILGDTAIGVKSSCSGDGGGGDGLFS